MYRSHAEACRLQVRRRWMNRIARGRQGVLLVHRGPPAGCLYDQRCTGGWLEAPELPGRPFIPGEIYTWPLYRPSVNPLIPAQSQHTLSSTMTDTYPPIAVGLMGTGEYTTGITPSGQSKSDKKIGVVGVTMFDLRRRGKVGDIVMAGTNGGKVSFRVDHTRCARARTCLTCLPTPKAEGRTDPSVPRDPRTLSEEYRRRVQGARPRVPRLPGGQLAQRRSLFVFMLSGERLSSPPQTRRRSVPCPKARQSSSSRPTRPTFPSLPRR